MRLPKLSLAQILIIPLITVACCGCWAGLARIWHWRLPREALVRLSIRRRRDDGGWLRGTGPILRASCDAQNGVIRRRVEVKSNKRRFLTIAADCDTWASLAEDGQLDLGRLESGQAWTVRVPLKVNYPLSDANFFEHRFSQVALSSNGELCRRFCSR